jgi:hypothetical protein
METWIRDPKTAKVMGLQKSTQRQTERPESEDQALILTEGSKDTVLRESPVPHLLLFLAGPASTSPPGLLTQGQIDPSTGQDPRAILARKLDF